MPEKIFEEFTKTQLLTLIEYKQEQIKKLHSDIDELNKILEAKNEAT